MLSTFNQNVYDAVMPNVKMKMWLHRVYLPIIPAPSGNGAELDLISLSVLVLLMASSPTGCRFLENKEILKKYYQKYKEIKINKI